MTGRSEVDVLRLPNRTGGIVPSRGRDAPCSAPVSIVRAGRIVQLRLFSPPHSRNSFTVGNVAIIDSFPIRACLCNTFQMRRIFSLIPCTVFALLSFSQLAHHTPHWSYLGATGPVHWGDLSSEFSTCKTGHQQSPINITDPVPSDLPTIEFHYEPATLKIIDNGHTVQVNYPPGSYITVGNQRYQLLQFHFHHPSEELIQGKVYDLGIHLVHEDAEGHKAVVAVLVNQGQNNRALQTIFSHLPKSRDKEVATAVPIDARNLLPDRRGYYTFPGSLTTPPCSEGVTWFVLKTPLTLSTSELAEFAKLYPHDARPVQQLNGRHILATR